jgi:hypothetical protein
MALRQVAGLLRQQAPLCRTCGIGANYTRPTNALLARTMSSEPGFFTRQKDKLVAKVGDRQQDKADTMYRQQVDNMVAKKTFSLRDFRTQLEVRCS